MYVCCTTKISLSVQCTLQAGFPSLGSVCPYCAEYASFYCTKLCFPCMTTGNECNLIMSWKVTVAYKTTLSPCFPADISFEVATNVTQLATAIAHVVARAYCAINQYPSLHKTSQGVLTIYDCPYTVDEHPYNFWLYVSMIFLSVCCLCYFRMFLVGDKRKAWMWIINKQFMHMA